MSPLKTEFKFTLPQGYMDPETGTLQKEGLMRLATPADELLPMRDPRVQDNPAYATIILLSRVITRLGTLDMISTEVIENLYSSDFDYLKELYDSINGEENSFANLA